MDDDYGYDSDIRQMIADTEKEIFDEAVGNIERDDSEDQLVDELSQAEAWDGSDLPIEEVAHRNMYGDTDTNYDRPIAMQNELSLAAENQELRDALAQSNTYINHHIARPALELMQQGRREQFRQDLQRAGLYDLDGDDAKIDQLIATNDRMQQHAQALEAERANASMAAAHQRYGKDFEDAHADLTHMDVNSPLARELVRQVWVSADPGEKLMEMAHNNPIVQGLGPSSPPPFLPRFHSPIPPRMLRPTRPSAALDAGWGDAETEADVFNSAFDDREY